MDILRKATQTLIAVGLLALGSSSIYAQDDYLSAIEAEAENTSVGQPAQASTTTSSEPEPEPEVPSSTPASATANSNSGEVSSRTDPRARTFEREFFDSFPGTYSVYAQLNESTKLSLINLYLNTDAEGDAKFQPVIAKIVETSLNN